MNSIGRLGHRRQPPHVVITEAQESQPDQLRRRQIRYVTMMGLRLLCLLAGVVVVALRLPYSPLWLALCIAGMVFLPWMAVLIANDRPPKKASQFLHRLRGHQHPDRGLESAPDKQEIILAPRPTDIRGD